MPQSHLPRNHSGGGMTGATGDLTPDGNDIAFMPTELRAMISPLRQAVVVRRHWPTDQPEHLRPAYIQQMDVERNLRSQREHGYDAPRGLAKDEPVYQLAGLKKRPASTAQPVRYAGGDTYGRPEDDRF